MRLPELQAMIEEHGSALDILGNIGFMSKLKKKSDHEVSGLAKEIYGGDMLDESFDLDAFERCGESFDTVISANPKYYSGSQSLKKAKLSAFNFLKRYLIALISFVTMRNKR